MSILSNIRKRGLKDILSWKRVKLYLTSKKNEAQNKIEIPYDEVDIFCEQHIYRKWSCPQCFEQNECTHCGCTARQVMAEPTGTCSAGHWFEMKSREEWEATKEKEGFEVTVKLK